MNRSLLFLCTVIALVLLGGTNVYAQSKKAKEKPEPVKLDPMFYKLGKFIVGYDAIDKTQYRNYFTPEEFQRVNAAFNMRKAGIGVTSAGAGLCVVASVMMGVGAMHTDSQQYGSETVEIGWDVFWAGFSSMMAGGAMLATGIPLLCVGESRLKKAAQGYNVRNNIILSVNVGQYGPGLALKF